MVLGYSLERALDKARQQVMTPKDYAVVGDGTHVLTQSDAGIPPTHRLVDDGDGYTLKVDQLAPWNKGGEAGEQFDHQEHEYHLNAQHRSYNFSRAELLNAIDSCENPVLYDGTLHWPDELANLL